MRILKVIAKVALSIAAMRFFAGSESSFDLGSAIVFFAVCYGLVSWYMFSFSNGGTIFMGYGLISFAVAMILNLCLPLLVIVVPLFILEAILPGQIGTIIYGIILSLACLGCILMDIVNIVRVFNPGFLGGIGDIFDSGS